MDNGILKKFFYKLSPGCSQLCRGTTLEILAAISRVVSPLTYSEQHNLPPLTLSSGSHLWVPSPSPLLLPAMAFLLQLSFWYVSSSDVYHLICSMISVSQQELHWPPDFLHLLKDSPIQVVPFGMTSSLHTCPCSTVDSSTGRELTSQVGLQPDSMFTRGMHTMWEFKQHTGKNLSPLELRK